MKHFITRVVYMKNVSCLQMFFLVRQQWTQFNLICPLLWIVKCSTTKIDSGHLFWVKVWQQIYSGYQGHGSEVFPQKNSFLSTLGDAGDVIWPPGLLFPPESVTELNEFVTRTQGVLILTKLTLRIISGGSKVSLSNKFDQRWQFNFGRPLIWMKIITV